jgi:dihydrofolate synthase/folylpolyglutamate synthase
MNPSPSELADFAGFSAYLDRLGLFHMDFGLHRMRAALDALSLSSLPHLAVQVVGTNGKGSTGAFLAAMLAAHGLPTGLYLSPHFINVRERILMAGKMLPETDWLAAANAVLAATAPGGENGRLTYFELLTVMAAWLFTHEAAEAAVYEAGLGGAGDATTALARDLILFTPIGMDHAAVIGPTLADIAKDKAQAMVPGGLAVTGPQPPEVMDTLRREADRIGARLFDAAELAGYDAATRLGVLRGHRRLEIPGAKLRLAGPHQSQNASLALAGFSLCADMLGLVPDPEWLGRALAETFIPGRLHLLRLPGMTPQLLLDCAHNIPALTALKQALFTLRIEPAAMIFTCLGDKDLAGMAPLAAGLTKGPIFVPELPDVSRARPAAEVAQALGRNAKVAADPAAALDAVRSIPGTVLACGSMYLLASLFPAPEN